MTKAIKQNYIARCYAKGCGAVRRIERGTQVEMWNGKPHIICACGSATVVKAISGRTTDTACSDKCSAAKGPSCECACGGENHGKNHC